MATNTQSDTERGLDGKVLDISGAAVTMDEIADYIAAADHLGDVAAAPTPRREARKP